MRPGKKMFGKYQDKRECLPRLGLIGVDGGFSEQDFFKTMMDVLPSCWRAVLRPTRAKGFV